MPHSEEHTEPWGTAEHVVRKREVSFAHETPDLVTGYRCRWPNELTEGEEFHYGPVDVGLNRSTGILFKNDSGGHTGVLHMIAKPGQDAAGDVECQARTLDPIEARTLNGYRDWKATHPDEEPQLVSSEWSNPQPLGEIQPDPVPEPLLFWGLMAGLAGLVFFAWRQKTR